MNHLGLSLGLALGLSLGLGLCLDMGLDPSGLQEDPKGPRITFDQEEYDFGSIKDDETKEVTLEVRNEGDEPLVIHRIWSSCSCALADRWRNETIPPGGSKNLKVKLASKGKYFGKLKKQIKFSTNDPQRETFTLWLKVDIKTDYALDPRSLAFRNVTRSGTKRKTVSIRSFMEKPLELKELSTGKFLKTAFRQVAPRDEEKGYALYALDVEVLGGHLPPGKPRIHTRIAFRPNTPKEKKDYILVVLHILDMDITAEPEAIDFAACPFGSGAEKELLLRHNEGKAFSVSKIEVTSGLVQADLVRQEQGVVMIRVSIVKKAPPGLIRGEMRLTIDNRTDCPMVIPVRGLIKPGGKAEEEDR